MLSFALAVAAPIVWVAPAECPSPAEVRGAVEHYIARDLGDEPLRARAVVESDADGGYALELTIEDDDDVATQRRLADADCRVLADAAALTLAIALDPEAASRATGPVLATEATGATDEAPATTATQRPKVETPPPPPQPEPAELDRPPARTPCLPGRSLLRRTDRNRLRPVCGALGVRFGLQLGPLPRFGPGVGGFAAMLWPRLRLEVAAAHWFEQTARAEGDAGVGGDIRLTSAAASGCGRLGLRRAEFDLCGGLELGALRGLGVGVDTTKEDRLLWVAALANARAGWSPVRRFSVSALVGTAVPLLPYRFEVMGLGTIHEATPAALRLGFSAEVRLP